MATDTEVEAETDFHCLPWEMQEQVLNSGGLEVKKTARLVCKRWLTMIDGYGGVHFLIKDGEGNQETLDHMFASKLEFDTIQLSNISEKVTLPETFPQTRKFVIGSGNSDQSIEFFLKNGVGKSQFLKLHRHMFESNNLLEKLPTIIQEIKWDNLQNLSVEAAKCGAHQIDASTQFSALTLLLRKAKIPQLKRLKFSTLHRVEEHGLELRRIILAFCKCLVQHRKTLKDLEIHLSTDYKVPDFSKHLDPVRTSQMDLERFEFNLTYTGESKEFGGQLENIGIACMAGQKNLKYFGFYEHAPRNPELTPVLEELFLTSGPKLESLELFLESINSKWFPHFTSLKSMKILNLEKIESYTYSFVLPNVVSITFGFAELRNNFAKWIAGHFPNLKKIILERSTLETSTFQTLHQGCPGLKMIKMNRFVENRSITLLKRHLKRTPRIQFQKHENPCPCCKIYSIVIN